MKPGHGEVLIAEGDVEVAEEEEPLVEEFRSRRGELARVAAANDECVPAVNYVPARYAATLAFAELPG